VTKAFRTHAEQLSGQFVADQIASGGQMNDAANIGPLGMPQEKTPKVTVAPYPEHVNIIGKPDQKSVSLRRNKRVSRWLIDARRDIRRRIEHPTAWSGVT
jgi:hypothetical protein